MHHDTFHSAALAADLRETRALTWRRLALGGFVVLSGLVHAALMLLPAAPPPVVQAGGQTSIQVRMASAATASAARPADAPQPSSQPSSRPSSQPAPQPSPARPEQTHATASSSPAPTAPARPPETPAEPAAPSDTGNAQPRSTAAPVAEAPVAKRPAPTPSTTPGRSEAPPPTPTGAALPEHAAAPAVARAEPMGAPNDASSAPREGAASHLREQLRRSLRAHFHYPRIARHRGWEGMVEVGLRVESNGRLSDIRVLRTSGFAVLDRAALASVGSIRRLHDAPEWLGGRPMDLVLPVQYRLIDG